MSGSHIVPAVHLAYDDLAIFATARNAARKQSSLSLVDPGGLHTEDGCSARRSAGRASFRPRRAEIRREH
jgi:hypothetical protein